MPQFHHAAISQPEVESLCATCLHGEELVNIHHDVGCCDGVHPDGTPYDHVRSWKHMQAFFSMEYQKASFHIS